MVNDQGDYCSFENWRMLMTSVPDVVYRMYRDAKTPLQKRTVILSLTSFYLYSIKRLPSDGYISRCSRWFLYCLVYRPRVCHPDPPWLILFLQFPSSRRLQGGDEKMKGTEEEEVD